MLTDNDLKSYINGYLQDRKMSYTRLDKHDRAIEILINENKRLNSIIKEVREYIKDKFAVILADDLFLDHDERIERKRIQHILEILDKVEEK